MRVIEVQFTPWDQSYYFRPENQQGSSIKLKRGDKVLVQTSIGLDIGEVVEIGELAEMPEDIEEIKNIERKAAPEDELKSLTLNKDRKKLLDECKKLIKKHKLEMKLVDVHISYDKRITFAFIADGRVDFRDLVKDLTRKYQKSIRLQQIGVRDEAKVFGDIGPCGRQLCCKLFLNDLGNVSTDHARDQQVAHRGSERLSGPCDRLKCCLRYEEEVYQELSKNFPEIGSRIKTKTGEGQVVEWHVLRGTFDVNIGDEEDKVIVEVPVK